MYDKRGQRTGLILIGVIILLLIGGVGIFVLMTLGNSTANNNPPDGQAGGQEPSSPQVTTVRIIIAAHDIRRGTKLTQDDVTYMAWPELPDTPLPADVLIVGDTPDQPGLDQVVDRVARVDILQNQPVLGNMITPADKPAELAETGSDAALLIPPGKIAIAVPIGRLSSVAYEIRQGDHVDILMSYRFIDVDQEFQTKLPNGVTTFDGGTGFTQAPNPSSPLGMDTEGREEGGPFGLRIMVVPSELDQRPRQSTQIMIANAVVLRVGEASLSNAMVVTPVASTEEDTAGNTASSQGQPQPTATPLPVPDIITLILSRQDALVLKYSLEVGADIDIGLRSAYENDVQDIKTDTVTLQYLFDFYNLEEPPKLPIGFDPSIDVIVNPKGNFQQSVPVAAPPEEEETTTP
jgi:pilus assembly protein CpaB